MTTTQWKTKWTDVNSQACRHFAPAKFVSLSCTLSSECNDARNAACLLMPLLGRDGQCFARSKLNVYQPPSCRSQLRMYIIPLYSFFTYESIFDSRLPPVFILDSCPRQVTVFHPLSLCPSSLVPALSLGIEALSPCFIFCSEEYGVLPLGRDSFFRNDVYVNINIYTYIYIYIEKFIFFVQRMMIFNDLQLDFGIKTHLLDKPRCCFTHYLSLYGLFPSEDFWMMLKPLETPLSILFEP